MQPVATQSPLSKVPVARILVPFILGILASTVSHDISMPAAILVAGIVLYIGLRLAPHTPAWSMRVRPLWCIPVMLVSAALGWGDAILSSPPEMDVKKINGALAQARINDIDYSDFSMSLYVTLTSVSKDSSSQLIDTQHDILLTTRGCDYTMCPGDMISFKCNFDTIASLGNPDGFDYQGYMLDQGIRYREHLEVNDIAVWGNDHTVITRCNEYRRAVQRDVFASSLSTEAQSFVIATLLGNSRFITPETRAQFSAAGIAHVLALSGLHVGIIMTIVWFILFPLDYMGLRRTRLLITIIAMGLYALFTGLSPSVVRATVMMVMVVIGLMLYRKAVSLNALATAAMVILVFSPSALYSVGFQLSFTTVAAFLLFFVQPASGESNKGRNMVLLYFKNMVVASIIAMLSTIMLTAWYFSSVSFTSVIANLIILPVFPVVMVTSATFLLLCSIGIHMSWLDSIINLEYDFIKWVATGLGSEMPGHIDYIYVTGVDVAIYYVALIFILAWYRTRKFMWMNYAMALVVLMLAHGAYVKATVPTRGMIIFNNYSETQIFYFNGVKGTLWTPSVVADTEHFKQFNRKFIAHYGIDSIVPMEGTEHAVVGGKRIVCITGGKWKNVKPLTHKIETDIMIVTKKYHGSIAELLTIYNPKLTVLSGDIYDGNIGELVSECASLGIPYYNIKEHGAWVDMD